MLSTGPITIVLNANNNKKIAIIRPSTIPGSNASTVRTAILREARNKFRIKTLNVIYLKGGRVVLDDDPVELIGEQVFVSKGEPYCGPVSFVPTSKPGEMRVIRGKTHIDSAAVSQLEQLCSLPGVKIVVGMPDLHPGNKFPIGCAVASEGIYPALIGSDAGCGIALYQLSNLSSRSLSNPKKLASLLHGLDDPWTGSVVSWLNRYGIERTSSFDVSSLGTVGAGNHFAEICSVEEITDDLVAAELGITADSSYLLVHTGSRGLGASILEGQTATDPNPYIPPDSPEFEAYLKEHDYAVTWAVANRDLVAFRIKQCLYGWEDDSPPELGKILDVTHNSVTKHQLVVEENLQDLWVHRKGAAPHDKGIIPCPGSRGDYSWLLQPLGNGQANAHSLAHGAGRRFSRAVMHKRSEETPKASLTTTRFGSEVICTSPDLLLEEQPDAYKDVTSVVEDMEASGICKAVVQLRPVVTYKVGR